MMPHYKRIILLVGLLYCANSCSDEENSALQLSAVYIGTTEINLEGTVTSNLPVDQDVVLSFSAPLNLNSVPTSIILKDGAQTITTTNTFFANNTSVALTPQEPLSNNTLYTLEITPNLKGAKHEKFQGQVVNFKTSVGTLTITSLKIGGVTITGNSRIEDIPLELAVEINFSSPVNTGTIPAGIGLTGPGNSTLMPTFSNSNQTLTLTRTNTLEHLSKYTLVLGSSIRGEQDELFSGSSKAFYTVVDLTPKFPLISDGELLTLVQQQTLKYFYDFAHPASGMARERNTSGNVVTTGGTGFGLMGIVVGIERGFITRQQGTDHLSKVLTFLEAANRFHGVWPHWLDGNTGQIVHFNPGDGGDIVETSFLMHGLLTFRQYLDAGNTEELALINRINALWESVEWDWYTNGQEVLYWGWSPTRNWELRVEGHNETLITYFLAAASPTHAIPAAAYTNGYSRNGAMLNGNSFYNITLPLGENYGGPLFFSHYSFLGLNPTTLSDQFANYWTQNVNHTLINHAYCADNPKNFVGYSDACWGLTASDNHQGYSAHSPLNDLGVITPTAALSSFPYTPDESMKALKFFYYTYGDKLWGEYGFYDAFNITEGWTASSYLAIDQGPIIVMIENYRTGLLWNLFMSAPEVQTAMNELDFN